MNHVSINIHPEKVPKFSIQDIPSVDSKCLNIKSKGLEVVIFFAPEDENLLKCEMEDALHD